MNTHKKMCSIMLIIWANISLITGCEASREANLVGVIYSLASFIIAIVVLAALTEKDGK